MNTDQLKEKWTLFKGDLKQQWAKFTDDDVQPSEGILDKVLGMLQEQNGGNCATAAQKWHSDKMGELLEWAGQFRHGPTRKQRRKRHADGKAPHQS